MNTSAKKILVAATVALALVCGSCTTVCHNHRHHHKPHKHKHHHHYRHISQHDEVLDFDDYYAMTAETTPPGNAQ